MIQNNLLEIQKQLTIAGSKPEIIAVIKKQPLSKIKKIIELGVLNLGVNYLQEFNQHQVELNKKVIWHYIGKLQTKKINKIVGSFKLIHSVDCEEFIYKIDKVAKKLNLVQDVLLQVNLANEVSKNGFTKSQLLNTIKNIDELGNIKIKGFMTMPPVNEGLKYFKELAYLASQIKKDLSNHKIFDITYLSMGTSGDYIDAALNGATHIRLGSCLLGERG